MTDPIPREDVIELLNRLGSDQDEDVLEAAREVHTRIAAANMTWDQLLVPDHAADDESDDDESDDDESDGDESDGDESEDSDDSDAAESSDSDEEATEPAGAPDAKNAESLALIDKLLAMRGISTDLREELKATRPISPRVNSKPGTTATCAPSTPVCPSAARFLFPGA